MKGENSINQMDNIIVFPYTASAPARRRAAARSTLVKARSSEDMTEATIAASAAFSRA